MLIVCTLPIVLIDAELNCLSRKRYVLYHICTLLISQVRNEYVFVMND